MNKEKLYMICKTYDDNFEVLEVCKDYLNALNELDNIKRYSQYEGAEEKYHIHCLEMDKYYDYENFEKEEVEK